VLLRATQTPIQWGHNQILDLPLLRLPETHRQRIRRANTAGAREGRDRRPFHRIPAHGRRPPGWIRRLPLLPHLRLHRILGTQRDARFGDRGRWGISKSPAPATNSDDVIEGKFKTAVKDKSSFRTLGNSSGLNHGTLELGSAWRNPWGLAEYRPSGSSYFPLWRFPSYVLYPLPINGEHGILPIAGHPGPCFLLSVLQHAIVNSGSCPRPCGRLLRKRANRQSCRFVVAPSQRGK